MISINIHTIPFPWKSLKRSTEWLFPWYFLYDKKATFSPEHGNRCQVKLHFRGFSFIYMSKYTDRIQDDKPFSKCSQDKENLSLPKYTKKIKKLWPQCKKSRKGSNHKDVNWGSSNPCQKYLNYILKCLFVVILAVPRDVCAPKYFSIWLMSFT